ncbi:MAG: biotin--[acetyl-CoA-carboxylase] ligase, partial [Pseudomonadota bacterium]
MSTDPSIWDDPSVSDTWPAEYDRVILDEVDSTMEEAKRRGSGLILNTWIMARKQTDPHGRRSRPWIEPEGNFAATLAIVSPGPPQAAALRSFIACVALGQTLNLLGLGSKLSYKWPNDVLLDGGKVAGILLENDPVLGLLCVGIGVNLRAAPDPSAVEEGAVTPVSVLGAGGPELRPDDLLLPLAVCFEEYERVFNTYGFDPIR